MLSVGAHILTPARQPSDDLWPQVAGAHFHSQLPFDQGLQLACAQDFALFDKRHAIAGDLYLAEQMRIKEYCGALFTLLANDIPHQAAPNWVQPGSWLIQDDQLWVIKQSLSQADALENALRK